MKQKIGMHFWLTLPAAFSLSLPLAVLPKPAYGDDLPFASRKVPAQERKSLTAATEGIRVLRAGDAAKASHILNAAIKFEPENAHLHFLNGVAYHLLFSQGQQANRELAETAYAMALQLAPDHALASYYLGLLHLDSRKYAQAQAALAHTLLLEREDPAALQALAVASYYAHDIGMALWAVERVEVSKKTSPEFLRTAALIYAAAGRNEAALERSRQLQQGAEPEVSDYVQKRVLRWQDFHATQGGRFYRAATETIPLTPDMAVPQIKPPAVKQQPAAVSAPPAVNGSRSSDPVGGKVLKNWSDCPQGGSVATGPLNSFGGNNSAFQDETTQLPALPSPCDRNAMPLMAMLDTAIISMVENQSTSRGVNLLDGLQVLLTGGKTRTRTRDTSGATPSGVLTTTIRGAALFNGATVPATAAGALLAYSLNIANAGLERNQVLARPTLIALDRQPSTFFSGISLNTVIQGNLGGGTLVEHPAGVSLSVTPTFVDEDTVLLSVKVTRSVFPEDNNDLRNTTVLKTRNAVTASVLMKMGETLILSGLTERETSQAESSVPLLRNIPVLQYLFSNETTADNTRSVLVMITPRKPQTGSNLRAAALNTSSADASQFASLTELRRQAKPGKPLAPNLETVFMDMEDSQLFREFRSGDVRPEDWRRPSELERTFKQISGFLYY